MTNPKTIVTALDIAARRCDVIDRDPATPKQCWYLASLLAKHGLDERYAECDLISSGAMLTKRRASKLIDELRAR